MNKHICRQTFTSPHTGKTYYKNDMISQFEYDRLSYSDCQRFNLTSDNETFAYQASNYFLKQTIKN